MTEIVIHVCHDTTKPAFPIRITVKNVERMIAVHGWTICNQLTNAPEPVKEVIRACQAKGYAEA